MTHVDDIGQEVSVLTFLVARIDTRIAALKDVPPVPTLSQGFLFGMPSSSSGFLDVSGPIYGDRPHHGNLGTGVIPPTPDHMCVVSLPVVPNLPMSRQGDHGYGHVRLVNFGWAGLVWPTWQWQTRPSLVYLAVAGVGCWLAASPASYKLLNRLYGGAAPRTSASLGAVLVALAPSQGAASPSTRHIPRSFGHSVLQQTGLRHL